MYIVYGASYCGFCSDAIKLLHRKGIKFRYYEIDTQDDAMEEYKQKLPTARTVPQIFDDDGTHIGGYDDLVEHLR